MDNEFNNENMNEFQNTNMNNQHLNNNIPRMERLIKNLNKYMKSHESEIKSFKIDQSEALQDTINIAIASFNVSITNFIFSKSSISLYLFVISICILGILAFTATVFVIV